MTVSLQIFIAVLMFLLGLRLSAFFSGIETGFYRASYLRMTVDAHAGDRIAKRLVWFAHHPSYFVGTTLIGNNVANYVTTLAIGLAMGAIVHSDSAWVEIGSTLALAPIIFLFAELLPKHLYYRAPMTLLRKDIRWFGVFFRLFYPITLPLVGITRIFERFSRREARPMELVLGRNRLVQVMSQGHREGLLTDTQIRLINGLMHTAGQSVQGSMTPNSRVLGVAESATREEILDHARRFGLSYVPIHRDESPTDWFAYVEVADVAISRDSISALRQPMPEITATASKLETLVRLRQKAKLYGRVTADGNVIGIVNEQELVEQLFRAPQSRTTGDALV